MTTTSSPLPDWSALDRAEKSIADSRATLARAESHVRRHTAALDWAERQAQAPKGWLARLIAAITAR